MKYNDAIKRVSLEYLADVERFINIALVAPSKYDLDKATAEIDAACRLATNRIQAVIALLKGEDE